MAASGEINDDSGVRSCFGKVALKLHNVKRGIRQFCTYMSRKVRSATRNLRQPGYTSLGGTRTSTRTHMEQPIIDEDVSRMLFNTCNQTEKDLHDLESRIYVAFQLHLTSHYTGEDPGIWTIEELTRMVNDLELKTRDLMWIWGMCYTDK